MLASDQAAMPSRTLIVATARSQAGEAAGEPDAVEALTAPKAGTLV